jgi:hypothetical protein
MGTRLRYPSLLLRHAQSKPNRILSQRNVPAANTTGLPPLHRPMMVLLLLYKVEQRLPLNAQLDLQHSNVQIMGIARTKHNALVAIPLRLTALEEIKLKDREVLLPSNALAAPVVLLFSNALAALVVLPPSNALAALVVLLSSNALVALVVLLSSNVLVVLVVLLSSNVLVVLVVLLSSNALVVLVVLLSSNALVVLVVLLSSNVLAALVVLPSSNVLAAPVVLLSSNALAALVVLPSNQAITQALHSGQGAEPVTEGQEHAQEDKTIIITVQHAGEND